MKKASILMLCLFCMQAGISGAELAKTIQFDSNNIRIDTIRHGENIFSIVALDDLNSDASLGAPSLPRQYVSLVLPSNAVDITVSATGRTAESSPILPYPLMPGFKCRATNCGGEFNLICDEAIYGVDSYAPESLVKILGIEDYYGQNTVVSLQVTPVRYNPVRNQLKPYENISITLSYAVSADGEVQDPESVIMWHKMNQQEKMNAYEELKASVFNPDDIDKTAYTCPMIMPFSAEAARVDSVGGLRVYEYSIITNRALGEAFERLASLKRQTGIDAGIIYIEDILSNPLVQNGDTISNINDDAGKLRQFLMHGARKTNLKYVLLGGKRPVVPIRYATIGKDYSPTEEITDAFEYKEVPSDWYYSKYTRNWNVDGDRFYGELKEADAEIERNLYGAYLYVGRIPCTTPDEVNNYIDKLEIYTLHPGNGDPSYLNAAYSHFSDSALSYDTADITKGEFVSCGQIGYSFNDYVIYRQEEMKPGQAIVQSFVDKKFGLLDFHCHSNPFQFTVSDVRHKDWPLRTICAVDSVGKWGPDEDGNGLDNMDNFGYPNVIYSISCTAAPFDAPEYCGYGSLTKVYGNLPCTLVESFLLGKNYGGVAFIGNAREGWFRYSARLEANFFRNFIRGGVNAEIGRMFNRSQLMVNSSEIDSERWLGYWTRVVRNLMGDPQLMLWRGVPRIMTGINAYRNDVNIQVSCHGDNDEANHSLECVLVEPDGTVHREYLGQLFNFKGVSPNSSVSVISAATGAFLPYICDLQLQNITFGNGYRYVYARKADVGESVIDSRYSEKGSVKFGFGCTYVLDASDDVTLNKGTVIAPFAKLKVYTPGTCTIDSVFIERSGILEIHASKLVINGKYTNDPSKPLIQPMGSMLTFGYDKYKRGDEAPIEIVDNTKNKIKARSNDYVPLLELGKEWLYTAHDCRTFTDTHQPDYEVKYRVDGIAEIDGKEYFIINEYDYCPWKGDRVKPYCYLREDVEEKAVYLREHPEFSGHFGLMHDSMCCNRDEEVKIYNFSNYDDQEMYRRSLYSEGEMVAAEIEANDGIHRGYMSSNYGEFGCFEGLGLLKRPETIERMYYGDICDLTGFYPMAPGGGVVSPFLYAVVAPDGTEIFSCDRHRPGAGVVNVMTDREASGEVEYYSMQGVRLMNPSSGTICIRRQGCEVRKVVIP